MSILRLFQSTSTRAFVPLCFALLISSLEASVRVGDFRRAQAALLEGRDEDAESLLEAWLEKQPESRRAHEAYQSLLFRQGRAAELEERYRRRFEESPSELSYVLLARVLDDLGAVDKLLRAGVERYPGSTELWYRLARVQEKRRRPEEALPFFEHATFDARTPLRWWVGYAHSLRRLEREIPLSSTREIWRLALRAWLSSDLERCWRLLDPLVQTPAGDRDALLLATRVCLSTGELDRARRFVGLAVAEDGSSVDALLLQSHVSVLMSDRQLALRSAERAVRLDSLYAPARLALAYAQMASGELVRATLELEAAYELDPSLADAAAALAWVQLWRGQLDAAERALRAAVRLDPTEAVYLAGLAEIASRRDDFSGAREHLEAAASLSSYSSIPFSTIAPDIVWSARRWRSRILVNLGTSFVFAGAAESALERFRLALEIDSSDLDAHLALARVFQRRGELKRAVTHYRELVRSAARDPRHRDRLEGFAMLLAYAYYESGETEPAIQSLRALGLSARGKLAGDANRLLRALESSRPAKKAEVVKIDSVRSADCARARFCVPKSVSAVLRRWELPLDIEAFGSAVVGEGGAYADEALRELSKREDLRAVTFLAELDTVKDLLRNGFPLVLLHQVLDRHDSIGHASVVAGFDDALRSFILEDANWFVGVDRLPYEKVVGQRLVLIAPPDQVAKWESKLGSRAYCALVNRAEWLAFREGDPVRARAALAVATTRQPNGALGHYYEGVLASNAGEAISAIASLRRAANLDGRSLRILLAYGRALLVKKSPEGVAVLRHTLRLEPRYYRPYQALAEWYLSEKRWPDAVANLKVLRQMRPTDPRYPLLLGKISIITGDYNEAQRQISIALALGADEARELLEKIAARAKSTP
ncbi:MAG: tetratricopeptide repeat protein [Planctomycetota bacterium]